MKGIKYFILALILFLILLICACELKRSNPLDPNGNFGVVVPNRVVGLMASGSGPGVLSKFVELRWNRNQENTDGYFVYMGLAYNSAYERVGWTSNISPDSVVTTIIPIEAPGFYYFKVSAYKYYGNSPSIPNPLENSSDFLEGSLSEYKLARVDN
jgi:hypothetical protein